jgi:hypothetical protein
VTEIAQSQRGWTLIEILSGKENSANLIQSVQAVIRWKAGGQLLSHEFRTSKKIRVDPWLRSFGLSLKSGKWASDIERGGFRAKPPTPL